MKYFCQQCGRRIKGRGSHIYCELCLIAKYKNAKIKKAERQKGKEITSMAKFYLQDEDTPPEEETPKEETPSEEPEKKEEEV